MSAERIWAHVSSDLLFSRWWGELCKLHKWSEDQEIEKWSGHDLVWPRMLDSLRSFTLFSRQKVILVQEADRALKKEKPSAKLWEELKKGPHHLIFQSDSKPPKSWPFKVWEGPQSFETASDERAVFRWIDAIQAQNLKLALMELEKALQSGQHPLVFLQLIARHYRMGRLIHHAIQKGLREGEILGILRLPAFVFQKWARSKRISSKQWQATFERLHLSDLQLKSGFDQAWVLRKLSFDLVEISRKSQASSARIGFAQTRDLFSSPLMSFAQP